MVPSSGGLAFVIQTRLPQMECGVDRVDIVEKPCLLHIAGQYLKLALPGDKFVYEYEEAQRMIPFSTRP